MKNKNIIGLTLIISSILVWLIDRTTLSISTYLGKLYCNKNYMRSVDGVIGDASCDFNTDMYVVVFLIIMLLTGMVVLISAKSKIEV